ncbi:ring-cleaving dioxygenase [Paenibacillus tarimensis]|uniref:ring-cleaving dioxygenase n=1 Tax=Paenibacillus tarimensis TaxID=416012 RepID=UPI001F23D330|nr:ring-cleaving dioxygenase [Paenibacillus tarimensis]MCF2943146.1 ring-cleaving dioxygenase [Paenibacillus tarimensis]
MKLQSAGIHHITAFARDPQGNVDFYAGVLGLRLVKRTINFDAPEVYHLYFGNEGGSPGTIITFFPWPDSRRGRIGGGQVGITAYAIPKGAMSFWAERLSRLGIETERHERFGEESLQFSDNEGLRLELVEREGGRASNWSFDGITKDTAIKGFAGAVLYSLKPEETMGALERVFSFRKTGADGQHARFQAAGDIGNVIDVPLTPVPAGNGGAGTVHHIAWRAKDHEEHEAWRQSVEQSGYVPTPIVDRQYFNAVYFREGGGILFEIATDPPGFARDEAPETLGEKLMLPEWFEPHREAIEANLQPIEVRRPQEVKR